MNVLFIHFSDLHFEDTENEIMKHVGDICNILRNQVTNANRLFIVISGDVSSSGRQKQFEAASNFFSELKQCIKEIQKDIVLDFITVPGNHDCNFQLHTDIRDLIIDKIYKNESEEIKTEYMNYCLEVQNEYFNWSLSLGINQFNSPKEKMYFEKKFDLENTMTIKFRCFNTAWMSRPGKEHENIVFPLNLIPKNIYEDQSSIVLSIIHHPSNWIKSEYSRKFRTEIEQISNIIITGHEHKAAFHEQKYLRDGTIQYFDGGILQGEGDSSFNTALVDITNRKLIFSTYEWNNGIYESHDSEWIDIPRNRILKQDKFCLSNSFVDFLSAPGVPFSHPRKEALTLQDIYVFPDIEVISQKTENELVYSENVASYLVDNCKSFIAGPYISGKTALLKRMFSIYQEKNLIPLWVEGDSINSPNPDKLKSIFNDNFERVYGGRYKDEFWGLDPSKKVLILDNLHDTVLNRKAKLNLFKFINENFNYVLISTEDLIGIHEIVETEGNDFLVDCKFVEISEFGNYMKEKLIEKWLCIGQEYSMSDSQLDAEVKRIDENTKVILSPKIIPSYPFYILTIAQADEGTAADIPVPFSKDFGSFGYFYDWLITASLHKSIKKIHDVGAKYRYLSEIAHHMYQNKISSLADQELENFHDGYLKRFSLRQRDLPFQNMIQDLISAKMLKNNNGSFEFHYPCIFYYFIARALNTRLQQPATEKSIKALISDFANNIDIKENEYILIFLSYLSENPYVREILIETASQMYLSDDPTDLEQDLDFINKWNYKIELKLPKESPKLVRQSIQKQEDIEARKKRHDIENQADSIDNIDQEMKDIRKAYRIIHVIGQIVKNFATSWEGPDKYKLAEASYLLGLRVLKHILTYYKQTVDDFVIEVKSAIKYRHEKHMLSLPTERRFFLTDSELEQLARATAFLFTFIVSLNGVLAVSSSVGNEKLYPTHKDVLERYKSLISIRLIDIAISIDCQFHIPLNEITNLLNDLKNNYVGILILRRLAYTRMCLRDADRQEKQRCCQLLDIKIDDPRLLMDRRKIDS